jgi:hypothetical protein
MEYVFGSTFVCKNIDAAKEVCSSLSKHLSRLFECVRIIWGAGVLSDFVITLTIYNQYIITLKIYNRYPKLSPLPMSSCNSVS